MYGPTGLSVSDPNAQGETSNKAKLKRIAGSRTTPNVLATFCIIIIIIIIIIIKKEK
jgi:hypothetical protein